MPETKKSALNVVANTTHFAKKETRDFLSFIESQNVIGIAVGLAVGTAASTLAKSVVTHLILDPISFFFGSNEGLRGLTFTLVKNNRQMDFRYGIVIDDLINFIIIALVFFFMIKLFKLAKRQVKK